MRKLLFAALLLLMALMPGAALATTDSTKDQSLTPQVKSISLPTGATLQYAEKGYRSGQAILFIHGYTDSWKSFSLVLPNISPKYRSIAVTQRGFGDSSKPESGYTGAGLAADIVALMDALQIQKAVIVGHSMGSFVAQQIAFTYPDRVEGLVLIGSAPSANNAVVQDLAAYVNTLEDPIDPAFVTDFQASTAYRPLPAGFLEMAVGESLKAPARVWKAAANGVLAENHKADLAAIKAPTLIMWGNKDSIFSQAEQRALVAAIPGARLDVFPDTGHAPHWEAPQRFTRDLGAFLKSLRKGR